MVETKKDIDQTKEEEKKNSLKNIGSFFNSTWLTGNMNFFFFLSLLAIIYIANGHWADKTLRSIDRTQKEIRDLQFEYKTVKSELMYKSEEAQVLKVAEPLGLKISTEVPQRLQVEKTK
ncbi:MAG: FtsL-like putative cell division protein [Chitinophagaceae bacterium]|nr:FtsL-like putative cell division protein [Chitinophagaceae bacterium]